VDAKELQALMASLGQDKKEEDIKKMLDEVDADGSGEIDVEEFLVLMVNYVGPQGEAKDEEIEEAFKLMDADSGGTIDKDELGDCLKKLGEPMQVPLSPLSPHLLRASLTFCSCLAHLYLTLPAVSPQFPLVLLTFP